MVDYNKAWVSIVSGGGGGLSLIAGAGVYFMSFFNVASPSNWIHCGVKCTRLGVVAHAGASHAIGLMVGVKNEGDVRGLTGGGWDFAVDIGARIGAMFKAGSKAGKALKVLQGMSKAVGTAKGVGSSEAGKAIINAFDGNFDLDSKGRGFYLFGTPAGLGIGAGVWYEWQEVQALGGADAWNFHKPKWRVIAHNGELWLQMKGIPEKDGATVIFDFREEAWGYDGSLKVTEPSSIGPSTVQSGEVKGFRLHEQPYKNIKGAPPGGGVNLTRMTLEGRYDVEGFWNKKVVITKLANQTLSIGLDCAVDAKRVWETDDYTKIKTDAKGDFTQVINPTKKWLD